MEKKHLNQLLVGVLASKITQDSTRSPQKSRNRSIPAIPHLGIYPKKMKPAYELSVPPCLLQLNSQHLSIQMSIN